jgi:GH25 family lysozyme M1 (1,4-beta-N-acetylmuramidase)
MNYQGALDSCQSLQTFTSATSGCDEIKSNFYDRQLHAFLAQIPVEMKKNGPLVSQLSRK